MNREECIKLFKEMLVQVEKYEEAYCDLMEAERSLNQIKNKPMTALREFDSEHKNDFIHQRAGYEPVKPKNILKVAYPIYQSKLKLYEAELNAYLERCKEAEAEYYSVFKDIRRKIEFEEIADKRYNTEQAEIRLTNAQAAYNSANAIINANDILSPKLKKSEILKLLIEYFQDKRVDTIKEAINLYFEEEHRKRLEELAKEQVRLTQEAAEQAKIAAENADEAAQAAQEAVNKANEAYDRADEAYYRADEAYDRADEAYNQAQNGY